MTGLNLKSIGEVSHGLADINLTKALLAVLVFLFDYLFKTKENFIGILTPVILISLVDTATGYMCAVRNKNVDSQKLSKMLVKAFSYSAYIVMAGIVDAEVGVVQFMGHEAPSMMILIKYMILTNEGHSIIENLSRLGFPIPAPIRARLSAFTDDGQKIIDNNIKNSDEPK